MRRGAFAQFAIAAAVAAGAAHVASCTSVPDLPENVLEDAGLVSFEDATLPIGSAPTTGPFSCMSSASCLPGQACCSIGAPLASCTTGACPSTSFGPIQLCVMSSECLTPGDTCGAVPPMIEMILGPLQSTLQICAARDGGSDGSSGDGEARDGKATDGEASEGEAGDGEAEGGDAAMDAGTDEASLHDDAGNPDAAEADDAEAGDGPLGAAD